MLDDRATGRLQESGRGNARGILLRILDAASACNTAPQDWLRQLPRYLKAEQRRWQRNAVRGSEPAHIAAGARARGRRAMQELEKQLAAEMRWTPLLDELRFWIEEYRVSLYAQELKTLGPDFRGALEQRAAEIEAWLEPLDVEANPCASAICPLQLMVLVWRRM